MRSQAKSVDKQNKYIKNLHLQAPDFFKSKVYSADISPGPIDKRKKKVRGHDYERYDQVDGLYINQIDKKTNIKKIIKTDLFYKDLKDQVKYKRKQNPDSKTTEDYWVDDQSNQYYPILDQRGFVEITLIISKNEVKSKRNLQECKYVSRSISRGSRGSENRSATPMNIQEKNFVNIGGPPSYRSNNNNNCDTVKQWITKPEYEFLLQKRNGGIVKALDYAQVDRQKRTRIYQIPIELQDALYYKNQIVISKKSDPEKPKSPSKKFSKLKKIEVPLNIFRKKLSDGSECSKTDQKKREKSVYRYRKRVKNIDCDKKFTRLSKTYNDSTVEVPVDLVGNNS